MNIRKHKPASGIPGSDMLLRPKGVRIRYCLTADDQLQLYVRHRGCRLIIVQQKLGGVLSELTRLRDDLAELVPPLLASTERIEAVTEFEKIVEDACQDVP